MNSVTVTTVDPARQVGLLDRLTKPARELLAQAEAVAGAWVVNARHAASVAPLAELLDNGLITRTQSGAYPLTSRGAAVWLYVPRG